MSDERPSTTSPTIVPTPPPSIGTSAAASTSNAAACRPFWNERLRDTRTATPVCMYVLMGRPHPNTHGVSCPPRPTLSLGIRSHRVCSPALRCPPRCGCTGCGSLPGGGPGPGRARNRHGVWRASLRIPQPRQGGGTETPPRSVAGRPTNPPRRRPRHQRRRGRNRSRWQHHHQQ